VLQEFGHTTNMGLQDLPTWGEDPAIPLALVKGYARLEEDHSPRAAAAKRRETRLRLEQDMRTRAQADPSAAALLPLLEMAQQFLPNLEDHNLLSDQRLAAASRVRWLRIGAHLVGKSALASAEDVFYYRHAELVRALEGGEAVPQEMITARRTLHQAYREASPPRVLGKPLEDTPSPDGQMVERRGELVVRGLPAAAGSYRGRVRVVESLAGAARLAQGDILVCTVTTPPWTPYFSLVGAVVTNAGGILSHGAIVAREFGIPAVVGTKNATALIPDGATVTVDGTAGIVIVER
jgi:pyruvate,water dikinase